LLGGKKYFDITLKRYTLVGQMHLAGSLAPVVIPHITGRLLSTISILKSRLERSTNFTISAIYQTKLKIYKKRINGITKGSSSITVLIRQSGNS